MSSVIRRADIEQKAKAFIQEVSDTPHDGKYPKIPAKELNRLAKRVAAQTIKAVEKSGGQVAE